MKFSNITKFLVVALLAGLWITSVPAEARDSVKVGVYQNRPLTFIEPDGAIKGFFIDIIQDIQGQLGVAAVNRPAQGADTALVWKTVTFTQNNDRILQA